MKHKLATAQKLERMFELRATGYTYKAIAQELGISSQATVYNMMHREMESRLSECIEHMRAMQEMRLDAALRAIWPQVLAGKLFAIDRLLSIEERRAKLLGLDNKVPSEHGHQLLIREYSIDLDAV